MAEMPGLHRNEKLWGRARSPWAGGVEGRASEKFRQEPQVLREPCPGFLGDLTSAGALPELSVPAQLTIFFLRMKPLLKGALCPVLS